MKMLPMALCALFIVAFALVFGSMIYAVCSGGTHSSINSNNGHCKTGSICQTTNQTSQSQPKTSMYGQSVTVKGTATEEVQPDSASFEIAITSFDNKSRAKSAEKCAGLVEKIKRALVGNGIYKKDIYASYYNTWERYDTKYDEKGRPTSYYVSGYDTRCEIKVKSDDVSEIGTAMKLAFQNGAANIENIRWSLKEETKQQIAKKVSKKAFENANDRAAYLLAPAKMINQANAIEQISYSDYYDSTIIYGPTMVDSVSNPAGKKVVVKATMDSTYYTLS